MKRTIRLGDRTVTYELTRKKVKNINIRVRADGSVGVSAGSWVPVTQIEAVLRARTHFLLDALDRFAAMESRRPVDSDYGPGSTVYLLGKAHPVVLFRGERNEVRQEGQTLQLFLKDPADTALRVKTMEAYLKEQCLSVTTAFCRQCQGKMAALGVPFPQIRVRSMTSRWGTCKPSAQRVTFARQLVEAPPACVEYVVYHELTHFLHPNHSKAFYDCLADFVPDWKARRDCLNSYSYR